MAKITLSKLAHSYMPNPSSASDYALREMDLVWQDGKSYALLGPSGCGKSTLLNIISGLIQPSNGSIFFDERNVTKAPTTERNIAQVFQFPVVYDTMTVRENLAFPLKNRGMEPSYIQRRTQEIAEMIGMHDQLDRKCQGLNADVQQKISLGRGMVREDVSAILFDEPLTVIDPHMKWELRTQLKRLHEAFGHTMIYVTHDQIEALTFADEVVVMYDGQVVQTGTPEDLFERPEHRFVGYFIGSPGMNFVPVRVQGNQAVAGEHTIQLDSDYGPPNDDVELGIRPEHLSLTSNPKDFAIDIERIEDVGHHRVVRAKFAGNSMNIIVPEDQAISEDMQYVQFAPERINLYSDGWRMTGGKA